MARITPTITSTLYRGVQGNQRKVVVSGSIDGTYALATAAANGVLITPSLVGLSVITSLSLTPTFTADTIEEYPTVLGPASDVAGIVLALSDKADNLQTAAGAVTGVLFNAEIYGY